MLFSSVDVPQGHVYILLHFLVIGNTVVSNVLIHTNSLCLLQQNILSNLLHSCFVLIFRGLVFDYEKCTKHLFVKTYFKPLLFERLNSVFKFCKTRIVSSTHITSITCAALLTRKHLNGITSKFYT